MKVQCKQCKEFRIVHPNESKACYEKRRPTCRKCGHENRLKTLGDHAPNWKGGRHIDKKGYVHVWIGPGSKYQFEHHAVWKSINGPIPKGSVIHHRVGNKQNNNIINLECLSKIEHDKMNPGIEDAWKYRWGYKTNNKTYA
jgi:hypothetical protein